MKIQRISRTGYGRLFGVGVALMAAVALTAGCHPADSRIGASAGPTGGPSGSATTSPTTGTSTAPAVTAAPTTGASTTGGSRTPPPPVTTITGRLFYLDPSSGALFVGGKRYPGGSVPSVNVSPNGRYVSWVDDVAQLIVSNVDGSGRRVLRQHVDPYCVEPVWSPDSTQLLFGSGLADEIVTVVRLDGSVVRTYGRPIGCHYRWSAVGRRAAEGPSLNGIVIVDPDTGYKWLISRDALGGRMLTDLVSISEGAMICLDTRAPGEPVGVVGRSPGCETIVDIFASKVVKLPVAGDLLMALFQPDGGALLRVKNGGTISLVLVDRSWHVVDRVVESPDRARMQLLAYVR